MSIEVVEAKLPDKFIGTVTNVSKMRGDYEEQFQIEISPAEENWKPIKTWVSIGKGSNEERVQKGSSLHEWVQRLNSMGLEGDALTEVFKQMIGKKFLFKNEVIGNAKNSKWVVSECVGG
ncbi:MAG: hypothetical protein HON47_02660 [Candidatus Diapherotrites archaeon]|jgi:hypothetical protein|uniref:Uncharacterized protein n=1 Tax=Candidatus Iainarchaeum sp. TaxID=3101447 RepID=A0A8T5GES1_9ARCH|nr:hypothetical protein [Candidatus Diapherotrites archaeon]MBT7241549.1 hypothetical protein [Candidatus Diapherotrites archaeon]